MSRLAVTLFAACVSLTGCADNQETLIVLNAPAWPDDGACVVDPGNDALLFGKLDTAYETAYLMPAALMNNNVGQSSNDNNTGLVSNEVQVVDADVTLDVPQLPELLDGIDERLIRFKVVLPSNSIPPGEVIGAAVEVIPVATVRELRSRMLTQAPGAAITVRATVVFNATRTANDVGKIGKIEAREFAFPIELCEDCLLDCSGCPDEVEFPECSPAGISAIGRAGGVCGNAQDRYVVPQGCDQPDP